MGKFLRERLPDPLIFFAGQDVPLAGSGAWRTGKCQFHGGSDSLRINVRSGAWRCMACGVKGGDVLAYLMQREGMDFVSAAKSLGAYQEDGKPFLGSTRPNRLHARDAMELAAAELLVTTVVIADVVKGIIPSDDDWQRYLEAARRVLDLAQEYRS